MAMPRISSMASWREAMARCRIGCESCGRLGGRAGRAGRHAPQGHAQGPLQGGVAELELRRAPSLQALPPGSQRQLQLAALRGAVSMQDVMQLAPEYFGDRAQIPPLAHAVDAQHVPPAIQQADEVRKRIDRAFPLELGARNRCAHARRMRRCHRHILAGLLRAFTAHVNSDLYPPYLASHRARRPCNSRRIADRRQPISLYCPVMTQCGAPSAVRTTTTPRWVCWIYPAATRRTGRQHTGGRQAPADKPTTPSTTCR